MSNNTSINDLIAVKDILSEIYSYLPTRNDWINFSQLNKIMYQMYQRGVGFLYFPPWPVSKAIWCQQHGIFRNNRDSIYGQYQLEERHKMIHYCFSQHNGNYLALCDRMGYIQLWHRCLGLIKTWKAINEDNETFSEILCFAIEKQEDDWERILITNFKGDLKAWDFHLEIIENEEIFSNNKFHLHIIPVAKAIEHEKSMAMTRFGEPIMIERAYTTPLPSRTTFSLNTGLQSLISCLEYRGEHEIVPLTVEISKDKDYFLLEYAIMERVRTGMFRPTIKCTLHKKDDPTQISTVYEKIYIPCPLSGIHQPDSDLPWSREHIRDRAALSPDGSTLAANLGLRVICVDTNEMFLEESARPSQRQLSFSLRYCVCFVGTIAFSNDGRYLMTQVVFLVPGYRGRLNRRQVLRSVIIDATTGTLIHSFGFHESPHGVCVVGRPYISDFMKPYVWSDYFLPNDPNTILSVRFIQTHRHDEDEILHAPGFWFTKIDFQTLKEERQQLLDLSRSEIVEAMLSCCDSYQIEYICGGSTDNLPFANDDFVNYLILRMDRKQRRTILQRCIEIRSN